MSPRSRESVARGAYAHAFLTYRRLSAAIERSRAARHRHQPEHFIEYRGWGNATHTRRRGNDEAMAQRGLDERLDIVGRHVIAPFQCGMRLRATEERQR